MARPTIKRTPIEASSGYVFADLGLADAAELDTKVPLAVEIGRLIRAHRVDQHAQIVRIFVLGGRTGRRFTDALIIRGASASFETGAAAVLQVISAPHFHWEQR